ncbi:MAG: hypothetical protein WC759_02390 [Candidatus Micrarchaeia archaeon]|jgi:hypothetical protein
MQVKQTINPNGIAARPTGVQLNAGRVFKTALLAGILIPLTLGGCDKAAQTSGNAQVQAKPPAAAAEQAPKEKKNTVEVTFEQGLPVWSKIAAQISERVDTPEWRAEMRSFGKIEQEITFELRYMSQNEYWTAVMSRPPIEIAEVQDMAFVKQAVAELHEIYTKDNWRPTIMHAMGENPELGAFYEKYGNKNLSLMEAWAVFKALDNGEKPKGGEYIVMGVGKAHTAYGIVLVADLIEFLSKKAGIPSPMTEADRKVYAEADAVVREALKGSQERDKTFRAMAQEIITGVNYQNKEYRVWSILLDMPGAYY